ncbi:MAG TPA: oxygen-dependent coproporphyrinogen oxidase [Cytophagaceae bacterium]|jgi:coproporphyrinogen III oxidase
MDKTQIAAWFKTLQDSICMQLEEVETERFHEDIWTRNEGGGGRTRILSKGNIFEKAGVAFSEVHGPTPDKILTALNLEKSNFYATGVSLVIHPASPHVPIVHMNTRYFEMSNGICWFGGGIDLTPIYVVKEDARYFHNQLKATCDKHDDRFYPKYKVWADDYFFNKHRNETRGVGGIFFDRLSETKDCTLEQCFTFVQDVGKLFAPLYLEIVNRHKSKCYSEEEKRWQSMRRGRYAEFNLVYDKGTKFGLDTNGRTESILMSMPPMAVWEYNFQATPSSREEETLQLLRKGINWTEEE